MLNQIHSP